MNKIHLRNMARFSPSPTLVITSWFLFSVEAFRNDHAAACSSYVRSAAEKNEMGGYVTVACSPKMTQRSTTAYWIKF